MNEEFAKAAESMAEMPEGMHPAIYWFICVVTAIEEGDFETAARANAELAGCGVEVRIRLDRQAVANG